jgi:hypothetical protein
MATAKDKNEIIVTTYRFIMPRAAKPTLAGRPKPAPQPRDKK